MDAFHLAPARDRRTDTVIESGYPGYGEKPAIEATGQQAVLTVTRGEEAVRSGESVPQLIEMHGVRFHVTPSVLAGGQQVLRGSVPLSASRRLFQVPAATSPPARSRIRTSHSNAGPQRHAQHGPAQRHLHPHRDLEREAPPPGPAAPGTGSASRCGLWGPGQ